MREATQSVIGECRPYSITGSLPLVGEMQEAGFDIQVGVRAIITNLCTKFVNMLSLSSTNSKCLARIIPSIFNSWVLLSLPLYYNSTDN